MLKPVAIATFALVAILFAAAAVWAPEVLLAAV
jgi:hypothetical protein